MQEIERRTRNPLLDVGPLRLMLGLLILLVAPMVLLADGDAVGWMVIPVYVAPVLTILIVWGLFFDLLMTRVFLSEKPPEQQVHYRRATRFDVGLLAIMFIAWGPFFYRLVTT